MSEEINPGFLKLYRKFFTHFLWEEKRVLSKAEAWIDLLITARYKNNPGKKIINGKMFTWERGQLIASVRYLQNRWQWKSTSNVERFLKMLVSENMIEIDIEQGTGRITICNYDIYNPLENTEGTSNGRKNNKPKFSDESIEIILSKNLYEKIKARNTKHKEPNFQTWAKHIDLMIRNDQRSPADIQRVIDWCQRDPFWQNNILSTSKLREKFDQLLLKMESPNGDNRVSNHKKPKGTVTGEEYSRQLREIYGKDGDDTEIY